MYSRACSAFVHPHGGKFVPIVRPLSDAELEARIGFATKDQKPEGETVWADGSRIDAQGVAHHDHRCMGQQR